MKNLKDKKRRLMFIGHVFVLSAMALLLLGSLGYKRDGPTVRSVVNISTVQASVNAGPWQEVTLPHKFENLGPRTPVSIKTHIQPKLDDALYVKTVYSKATVYFNEKEVFRFGQDKNYPDFMVDPATELHMIETFGNGSEIDVRIDFLSPVSRNSLVVHPFMVGTTKELMMERSRVLGISFVFSLAQIIGGIALILISVCIVFIDKKGILFLWLGLFSLVTGAWSFGENNFSSIIFRDSTFLYMMSFIGLFTFAVPLLRFTRAIIEFENPNPIWYMELFCAVSAGIALWLQLAGLVACSKSMYFFHLCLPLVLIFLFYLTAREYLLYKNTSAGRFILPIGVLALSGILELCNYRLPFTYAFSSIFQLGILFFLLFMGVTAGLTVKDSIDLKNRQKELTFEKSLMDIQIKDQQNHSALLAQHEQQLRQQRHDLRHHLNAIMELTDDKNPALAEYLQTLIDKIPKSSKLFCENRAVNAIVCHYDTICSQSNIEFTAHLVVPENTLSLSGSSLCVIFGNLLENAVEACSRMNEGKRFIKLNSSLQFNLLTITMDNSFNGKIVCDGDQFISSKRNELGIGLTSVRSVALKSGGDAEFKPNGQIFESSVFVKL